MKAAVYKGNHKLVVEKIPTPAPKSKQVLVKVKYCAICGTDVHSFLYDAPPPGTVMGHEYCGTIAEIGTDITRWKVGDRVVGGGGNEPIDITPAFKAPRFNYRTMGFNSKPIRAYAEYIVMEEWEPLLIPDDVSDEEAALCEPMAVAVHAVKRSRLKIGDSVVVIGAGPIGLFCLQVAIAAGAKSVTVIEPSQVRRKAALQLGATAVLEPKSDLIESVLAQTDGIGPNIVFECAGATKTLDQAMNIVRRDGQVMLVALAWEPTPLLPVDWIAREINLETTFSSTSNDWKIALNLIENGKIITKPMLPDTSFVHIDNIQQAFEDLVNPSSQLQMVVRFY